jgi:hypothetical protein
MATGYQRAKTYVSGILKESGAHEFAARLRPKVTNLPPSLQMHEEI